VEKAIPAAVAAVKDKIKKDVQVKVDDMVSLSPDW
jgi:hypothetical protein